MIQAICFVITNFICLHILLTFNFASPAPMQLILSCASFRSCHMQKWRGIISGISAKETAEDVLLKCHLPNGVLKAIIFFPFCPIEPNEIVNSQLSNQACNKYVYFKTSGKIWKNFFTGLVHIYLLCLKIATHHLTKIPSFFFLHFRPYS